MRIRNLEFRDLGGSTPPEIVQWIERTDHKREYCIAIVLFRPDEDGVRIEFIRRRPFDVDAPDLLALIRYGQEVLDARHRLMKSIEP